MKRATQPVRHVGPNMTPMVDVVLCILIFFMLSMTFQAVASKDFLTHKVAGVPGTGHGPSDELPVVSKRILLTAQVDPTRLDRRGRPEVITTVQGFDGKSVAELREGKSAARIVEYMTQQRHLVHGDVQLILAPQRGVPYRDVIAMYDACLQARFDRVIFAQTW